MADPKEADEMSKTLTTKSSFLSGAKGRNMSVDNRKSGSTFTKSISNTTVKPKLLESKIATAEKFSTLSDGFKRVFANDSKDQKMVIPICGYGGHRRGDQS